MSTTLTVAQISSVDSGAAARSLAGWDEALLQEWGATQPWLRIRSHPDPRDPAQAAEVSAEVAGLARLSALGFKPIPFLRWGPTSWQSGVRVGMRQRLPLDLREAYRRGFDYGQTYGAVVAGFEIENEPDISFVNENAETYLAFQKAVYLGLKGGALVTSRQNLVASSQPLDASPQNLEPSRQSLEPSPQSLVTSLPSVVMAPLALPPGPYFEQLVDNGLFSYTDAFNYHYYGYAEDFSGVYSQFEHAVHELGNVWRDRLIPPSVGGNAKAGYGDPALQLERKKNLPVLLTEYGYGSLGDPERNTVEGRVRQCRWFKSVGAQVHDLKIAGPMAFYVPPYFENKSMEFGLTLASRKASQGAAVRPQDELKPETGNLTKREKRGDGATIDNVGRGRRTPPLSDLAGYGDPALQLKDGGDAKAGFGDPALQHTDGIDAKAGCGDPALQFMAGNLAFTPSDFGLEEPEPWMEQIGRQFGENEATPALAWLYDRGLKHPYEPKNWTVSAPAPSPVVIDFIADEGLAPMKRYGGYIAMGEERRVGEGRRVGEERRVKGEGGKETSDQKSDAGVQVPIKGGSGQLVLYNFSDQPITGQLEWMEGRDLVDDAAGLTTVRTLEPMSRSVIPIEVKVPAQTFTKHRLKVRFVSADTSFAPSSDDQVGSVPFTQAGFGDPALQDNDVVSQSVFATVFYPDAGGMKTTVVEDFGVENGEAAGRASVGNGALLESRSLATEEPRLEKSSGRWLTTSGLTVKETAEGSWQFEIRAFPPEPNRPAMAELPLPDDFQFPDEGMMKMIYRLIDPPGADLKSGQFFELYFRTANGNLYQVWPRQYAMADWQGYTEVKENYTMAFYGRAALPWRFADNRPVALVFFFRPKTLPATYEVRDAQVVKLGN